MNENTKYKCWWCGNPADSGEHKFKRTDLIEDFGSTFKDKENCPILIKGSKQIKIQGPNSEQTKFEKIMCSHCNNNKSQKIDETYTIVMHELIRNDKKYENKEFIDFRELFGNDWLKRKQDFISYFIKHFCCRLARNNVTIPKEVINYLNKETKYLEYINLNFQHRLDLKRVLYDMRNMKYNDGFLAFGKLMLIKNAEELDVAYSYLTRKWIRVGIYFSDQIVAENFPDLEVYYQTPYLTYKLVSIFHLEKIRNYDDIVNAVQAHQRKKAEVGVKSTEDLIDEYFIDNPYKLNYFSPPQSR
jgi:hypothetical protein